MIGNIVGTYKITEKIGEGGMGSVFKGIDLMLEREVAIKVLRPELAGQPEIVERFRAEAVTLAKLNHPKIATLYSFFRHGNDFLMVMEFVRGQTLGDVINQHGSISCDQAVPMFCQALEGIDHAHSLGIIHRDVKPGNMMLTPSGTVKVMDFGIARVLGAARMTKAGHLVGTIEYMSPEQVRGMHTDARSDIYSSGIVLYEMLTGRVPFSNDSEYDLMRSQIEEAPPPPRSLSAAIPDSVEQAILRALAKKPEERFETAGEFRTALLAAGLNAGWDDGSHTRSARADQRSDEFRIYEDTPKETRLAGSQEFPVSYEPHIKGTRLLPDVDPLGRNVQNDFIFEHEQRGRASGSENSQQTPDGLAGILTKLNWKHYAGACLVLALLTFASIASIAFIIGDEKATDAGRTNEAPVTSRPPAVAVPTSSADVGASQTSGRPASQPQPNDASGMGIQIVTPDNTSSRASNTGSTDDAGKQNTSNTSRRTSKAETSQRTRRDNTARRTETDDRARQRARAREILDQ